MKEECVVTKINGKIAYIRLARKEQCSGCKACVLGRGNKTVVPAIIEAGCNVGDTVLVETPQKDISPFALFIYLIPLVFLVIGFFAGGVIAAKADNLNADTARVVTALIFLLISFVLCFLLDFFCRRKKEYMHIIKGVVKRDITKSDNN